LGRWNYIGGCSTADPRNVQGQVTNDLFLLRRLLQLQLCNDLGSGWFINIALEGVTQFCLCAVVEAYNNSQIDGVAFTKRFLFLNEKRLFW